MKVGDLVVFYNLINKKTEGLPGLIVAYHPYHHPFGGSYKVKWHDKNEPEWFHKEHLRILKL